MHLEKCDRFVDHLFQKHGRALGCKNLYTLVADSDKEGVLLGKLGR